MSFVVAILGAVTAIFSVVVVHECGHFIVARLFGVRILRFSIGFGKAVWSRTTRSGMIFAIGWLPLGGYVSMLDETDKATPEDMQRWSYHHKPVYQRMAIVLAGPLMNFLLALVLYWLLLLPGVVHIKPVIGRVLPGSLAARAGLISMDRIVAVDNRPVVSWHDVAMAMIARINAPGAMAISVDRSLPSQIITVKIPLSQWQVDERKPTFLKTLGIVPYQPKSPLVLSNVVLDSPAWQAGLRQGDHIKSIDGKRYSSAVDVTQLVQRYPDQWLFFKVERNHRVLNIALFVRAKTLAGKTVGFAGFQIAPPRWPSSMIYKKDYNVLTAWLPAARQTSRLIAFNGLILIKMISGQLSLRALGGPVSIFEMAGKASQQNYRVYLGFLAFLSVALGFINLLPIPALDGGHFLFQLIELICRRSVPMRVQALCTQISFVLLILLILNVTFNDLSRIFSDYW